MLHLIRIVFERWLPPWATDTVYLLVSFSLCLFHEAVPKWQVDFYLSFLIAVLGFQIIQFFLLFFIFLGRSKMFDPGQVDTYSWELIDSKNAKSVVDTFAKVGFVVSILGIILLSVMKKSSIQIIGAGFACLSYLELLNRAQPLNASRTFIEEFGGHTLIALIVGICGFQISGERISDLLRAPATDVLAQQSLIFLVASWGTLYFFLRLGWFLINRKSNHGARY